MRQLKWLWGADCFQPSSCPQYICNAAFSLLKNHRMFTHGGRWKIKRGGVNGDGVCIACGGHYFWRALRLGELENIILSGWFDSAMKNVRSGDDKSRCWGEGTGRQGMSFVMSAIWLHPPLPPPSLSFLSASSSKSHPFSQLPPITPQLPPHLPPKSSARLSFLSIFILMIYLHTFVLLSSFFIIPITCPHSVHLFPISSQFSTHLH